jgi:hypothetical protein
MTIFKTQIVQFLLPLGRFGIAIHGGLDFTINYIQFLVDGYIPNLQTSTRALILLDFNLFFKEVLCKAYQHVITQQLIVSPILHYFMLIYAQPNKCWARKPDNTWKYILQLEGFCQRFPIGPLFSTLVL